MLRVVKKYNAADPLDKKEVIVKIVKSWIIGNTWNGVIYFKLILGDIS